MAASRPGSMRGPRLKTPLLLLLHLHRLLLLLLLLLGAHTRTVSCQYDDEGAEPAPEPEEEDEVVEAGPEDGDALNPDPTQTDADPDPDPDPLDGSDPLPTDEDVPVETPVEDEHGSGQGRSFTGEVDQTTSDAPPSFSDPTAVPDPDEEVEEEALSPIVILIPVVLVVVIIAMIVCGIFINRRWNNARNQELGKDDPYLDGSSTEKVPMPMFEEDVPSVLELEMEELDQWMKKDGETAEESKNV